jgi:GTPase involved in cell partitioning and DNA repair
VNISKIYDDNKSDLEILKKYIEEVNDYHSKLYKTTEYKLHNKPDFDLMTEFKQNVEDKVMKDLQHKIDKMEYRRVNNTIQKKMESMEKEIVEMGKITLGGSKILKTPFLKVNEK